MRKAGVPHAQRPGIQAISRFQLVADFEGAVQAQGAERAGGAREQVDAYVG